MIRKKKGVTKLMPIKSQVVINVSWVWTRFCESLLGSKKPVLNLRLLWICVYINICFTWNITHKFPWRSAYIYALMQMVVYICTYGCMSRISLGMSEIPCYDYSTRVYVYLPVKCSQDFNSANYTYILMWYRILLHLLEASQYPMTVLHFIHGINIDIDKIILYIYGKFNSI